MTWGDYQDLLPDIPHLWLSAQWQGQRCWWSLT
jgi:hypothetical protein